jgi:hypothetical protein
LSKGKNKDKNKRTSTENTDGLGDRYQPEIFPDAVLRFGYFTEFIQVKGMTGLYFTSRLGICVDVPAAQKLNEELKRDYEKHIATLENLREPIYHNCFGVEDGRIVFNKEKLAIALKFALEVTTNAKTKQKKS